MISKKRITPILFILILSLFPSLPFGARVKAETFSQTRLINNVISADWTNPANAFIENDLCTYTKTDGADNHYNFINNPFDIPEDATIEGIRAEWRWGGDGNDWFTLALKDANLVWTKAFGQPPSISCADAVLIGAGGSNNLWGSSWTPSHINSANFVCWFEYEKSGSADFLNIDYMEVTVWFEWTPPDEGNGEGEGYGEENESLGQFTDDFESLDNVTVIDDLIRNSTLNCIELNYTTGVSIYQDFTLYTEQDPNNDLTINSSTVEFETIERKWNTTVYYDFGIDYFGDFTHIFTLILDNIEAGDGTGADTYWPYAITNVNLSFGSMAGLGAVAENDCIFIGIRQEGSTDDRFRWRWIQRTNGVIDWIHLEGSGTNNPMGKYYFTIFRSGNTVNITAYSDEARTTIQHSYQNAGSDNSKYRFLGNTNQFSAGDGNDWISGAIRDLWLNGSVSEGYESDGYFITENYLNYTSGNALVQLTNASIPSGTSLTVQFSNDNSTWIDHDGNVGSTSIVEGFYSIDLRDLNYSAIYQMYNFTGTPTLTPRLYQSRLVTTDGNVTAGPPAPPTEDSFFWVFIAIALSIIVLLVSWLYHGDK